MLGFTNVREEDAPALVARLIAVVQAVSINAPSECGPGKPDGGTGMLK
jgi:hypothetical protein